MEMAACARALFLVAGWIVISASAQSTAPPTWETAAGGKMAFEVAAVKPTSPGTKFTPPIFALDAGDSYASTGGRFWADFPLSVYIAFAYKISLSSIQGQQLPKWVGSDRFNIQAKAEGNPTKDQMRLMMQALLADRFKLAVHFETNEAPVFVLTLAKPGKLGPNLRPHADGPSCDVPDTSVFPSLCDLYALTMSGKLTKAGARNTTMDTLAEGVSGLGRLGRPVIDKTGLSGRFDFTLEWLREGGGPAPPEAGVEPDLQGPTFLEALREQLGLKLESTRGPVQTLVVDHVERPSEN
jgi:bla regulator protein blaR1